MGEIKFTPSSLLNSEGGKPRFEQEPTAAQEEQTFGIPDELDVDSEVPMSDTTAPPEIFVDPISTADTLGLKEENPGVNLTPAEVAARYKK